MQPAVIRTVSRPSGLCRAAPNRGLDTWETHVPLTGCKHSPLPPPSFPQWDVRSAEMVQEYDRHLGAVNTITFVDNGRQFVTSSDDNTIRVWEMGIGVDVKYIADPEMHSMPYVSATTDGKFILTQSLDNQVLVFDTTKFKVNKKKQFTGHMVAGYACGVQASWDRRFVMSGDSNGLVHFWAWQRGGRALKTLRAHDKVTMDVQWHPKHASTIATCSWDGTVKIFQ